MIPVRYLRVLVIAMHVFLLAVGPLFVTFGARHEPPQGGGTGLLFGAAILALQLRHSLAVMRGERPGHGKWTFALLVVLVVVPQLWFTWTWGLNVNQAVAASALMVLRRRAALAWFALVALSGLGWWVYYGLTAGQPIALVQGFQGLATGIGFPLALYGGARVVRIMAELEANRRELAELAVNRERLRISRDLHDLLGQSLSAFSLKGDLALRLLIVDPPAARAEVAGMAAVAGSALGSLREISRGEHSPTFAAELAAAQSLVQAAGIRLRTDIEAPAAHEEVLAWTLREAVTNLVRHSAAGTATITLRPGRLEIVNDGADSPGSDGNGLPGLRQRARAHGGQLHTHCRDGEFRLVLELPVEAP
ncbi:MULTISPECIES: sensor histidine kinase [unclassified Crossiella]|uniref:sensor histidine kinase n=1 Tax=unclassified Crossiella TaxID=2620835 RepID=UPI001FFFD724|nr:MULTISPECIES: histidine kinase [unclassified Crossiella]MCK2243425.1 histidine kinase [Crossiella sp. S99.2]MCK2257283.1 histidine kinase [Crossiella sp. S99.1]